jgi:hypothetical protein
MSRGMIQAGYTVSNFNGGLVTMGAGFTGLVTSLATGFTSAWGAVGNLLAAVIPVAGGLIGMWLNHHFQMKRDERREKRESNDLRSMNTLLGSELVRLRKRYRDTSPLPEEILPVIEGEIMD